MSCRRSWPHPLGLLPMAEIVIPIDRVQQSLWREFGRPRINAPFFWASSFPVLQSRLGGRPPCGAASDEFDAQPRGGGRGLSAARRTGDALLEVQQDVDQLLRRERPDPMPFQ